MATTSDDIHKAVVPWEGAVEAESALIKAASRQIRETALSWTQARCGEDIFIIDTSMTEIEAEHYVENHWRDHDFQSTVAAIRIVETTSDNKKAKKTSSKAKKAQPAPTVEEQAVEQPSAPPSTLQVRTQIEGRRVPKVGEESEEALIAAQEVAPEIKAVAVLAVLGIEEQRITKTIPSPTNRSGYAVKDAKDQTLFVSVRRKDAQKFMADHLAACDGEAELFLHHARLNDEATEEVAPESMAVTVETFVELELEVDGAITPLAVTEDEDDELEEEDVEDEEDADDEESGDDEEEVHVGWVFFGFLSKKENETEEDFLKSIGREDLITETSPDVDAEEAAAFDDDDDDDDSEIVVIPNNRPEPETSAPQTEDDDIPVQTNPFAEH